MRLFFYAKARKNGEDSKIFATLGVYNNKMSNKNNIRIETISTNNVII
ncbi:MAG: hypothetical protein E6423_05525 [Clostridium sp.]|nr:hypothetical protein [Clostridium sp.]